MPRARLASLALAVVATSAACGAPPTSARAPAAAAPTTAPTTSPAAAAASPDPAPAGPAAADDAPARAPAPAPPRRGRLGPAVDISLGGGLHTGDLGEQARRSSIMYRLGAGLSRGGWAALVSGHFLLLGDLSEPRTATTVTYLGVGVEPSLRRELTTGSGARLHMRLGYTWRWLRGDQQVQRLCDVHGGCDGGFWQETPTYPAHGPVLAFGLGWRPATRGTLWPAFGIELAFSHHTLDRRGADPDLRSTFLSLALNIALGRD